MQIDSIYLTPILDALKKSMQMTSPQNNPVQSYGTIQQNFGSTSSPTLYNAHGIVTPNNPNTLIAKV